MVEESDFLNSELNNTNNGQDIMNRNSNIYKSNLPKSRNDIYNRLDQVINGDLEWTDIGMGIFVGNKDSDMIFSENRTIFFDLIKFLDKNVIDEHPYIFIEIIGIIIKLFDSSAQRDMIGRDNIVNIYIQYTVLILYNKYGIGKIDFNSSPKKLFDIYSRIISDVKEEFSVKTLAHYVMLYNNSDYESWYNDKVVANYRKCVNNGTVVHVFLAKHFYFMYWTQYLCIKQEDSNKLTKYVFSESENRLKVIGGNIIDDFVSGIIRGDIAISKNINGEDILYDNNQEGGDNEDISLTKKIIYYISNTKNKLELENEMCKFFTSTLNKKLDSSLSKMSWKNKVLFATPTKAYLCDGKLEDYITYSTNVEIHESYDHDHDHVKLINDWFTKLMGTEKLGKLLIAEISSLLIGGNKDKKIRFMIANGNNGKSTFNNFISSVFGVYARCVSFNIFNDSSTLNDGLYQSVKSRFLYCNETNQEKFNNTAVKSLTGGDTITVRALYKSTEQCIPAFKPFFCSNSFPTFDHTERAIFNRLLIINVKGTWKNKREYENDKKEKPYGYEHTHMIDPTFGEKLNKCASIFASMLFEAYNEVYVNCEAGTTPLSEEKEVSEYTEYVWKKVCKFYGFMDSVLIETKNPKDVIYLNDLLDMYKNAENARGKSIKFIETELENLSIPRYEDKSTYDKPESEKLFYIKGYKPKIDANKGKGDNNEEEEEEE